MSIKYLLVIFSILSVVSLVGQEDLTEETLAIQRNLIEANKHFILEHYDDANTAYRNVLSKDAKNAPAFFGLSRIYMTQNDLVEAEKNILKAIECDDQNIWYYDLLIQIRTKQKNITGKAEALEQIIVISPKSEKYYLELSKSYDQLKDYKKAIKTLERIETDEVNPMISYRKARLYTKMKKPDRAVKEYQKMIADNVGDTRFLHMLASHYRSVGEESKAIEIYSEIIKLDPDDSRAGLAVANEAKMTGNDLMYLESIRKIISSSSIDIDTKVKELIPFVQKMTTKQDKKVLAKLNEYAVLIMDIHPNDAKGFALGADINHIIGNNSKAIDLYASSLSIKKSIYPVWEQYLFLLLEEKEYDKLAIESSNALDYFPNRGRLYFMSAYAHNEQRQFDEALSEVEQAKMMSGRDQVLLFDVLSLLGKVNYHKGNHDKAIQSFEEALTISPNNDVVFASYAYVLAQIGEDLDKALVMSESAYSNAPNRPSFILSYAWVLAKNGQVAESLNVMEGTSDMDQQSAEYIERYGDILFMNGRSEEAVKKWQEALDKGSSNVDLPRKISNRSIVK
jgi:tetratricopeptide (TPR) repeat protein